MANKSNRQYKSTLFSTIFSDKVNALEMYNALNGTDYDNPDEITITTLKNVVFINRYNDVSYVLGGVFSLYEHQSTDNLNMPLRSFFYIAQSYEKMVDEKKLLSRSRVIIPTPKFVVFYNGSKEQPDVEIRKLSDSYANKEIPGDLELTVTMLNVNYGHNAELMKKCQALNGYSLYISKFREYTEENGLEREEAAQKAVEYCINNGVMPEFFKERRKEVIGMILEVTEEVVQELISDLEDENEELTQLLEAEFRDNQEKKQLLQEKMRENEEQEQIIQAKMRENEEQEQIIQAKVREGVEKDRMIESQNQEIEKYKQMLKDNGIEV